MKVKLFSNSTKAPSISSKGAAGYDIYMPEAGQVNGTATPIKLGFATAIPQGWAAVLMPRSGVGAKAGLELNNTVGLIDSDYRGEWVANLRTKGGQVFSWEAGERLLQFILIPVENFPIEIVEDLETTERGEGGFGSSGK